MSAFNKMASTKVSNTAHGLFHPKCTEIQKIKFEIYVKISTGTTISQEMLKQTLFKNNIHIPVGFATSSNDLTNQRLLRHVISCDYIMHEFRVIPKQCGGICFVIS